MEEKRTTSFFHDTQKLTFALGLSWGLAVMAIVGFVIVVVQNGGSGSGSNTLGAGGGGGSDTTATDTTAQNYDPAIFANAVGIDQNKFSSCLSSGKYKERVDRDLNEGSTIGVDGTPSTFINGTKIAGAYPYADVKAAIDAALAGTKGSVNVPALRDDDHFLGKKNATVQVIEYTDYQCPFCQRFHPTVKQAIDEYGDKIVWVLRHFPLTSIHPYAQSLAEGAECAKEIGGSDKFWEYTDKVFEG